MSATKSTDDTTEASTNNQSIEEMMMEDYNPSENPIESSVNYTQEQQNQLAVTRSIGEAYAGYHYVIKNLLRIQKTINVVKLDEALDSLKRHDDDIDVDWTFTDKYTSLSTSEFADWMLDKMTIPDGYVDDYASGFKAIANNIKFEGPCQDGTNAVPEIEIHNGKYQRIKYVDDETREFEALTTFILELNARLTDKNGDKLMDITVHPCSNMETSYDVVVKSTVFNDKRTFANNICTGFSTAFNGSTNDLNDIRKIVSHQPAPHKSATSKIGLHEGDLVTRNTVYTTNNQPKYTYDGTDSLASKNWLLDDLEVEDEDEVARILELIGNTRSPERIIPILGWYYTTLWTPMIREHEEETPQLMIYGDTKTGKSSSLKMINRFIGMKDAPSTPDESNFSQLLTFSSSTSLPVWIDEYKPSELSSFKLKRFKRRLRVATQGGYEGRGNTDMGQDGYHFTSPIVLSGEQEIKGNAEQRRNIRVQLSHDDVQDGTSTARAFKELRGISYMDDGDFVMPDGCDLLGHAKYIHNYVLENPDRSDEWLQCKKEVYELLGTTDISELEVVALTYIKFGIKTMRIIAEEVGADMSQLPTMETVDEVILTQSSTMGDSNRESHAEEFIKLLSDAADQSYIHDGHDYTFVNQGSEEAELLIKVRKVHAGISKYVTDYNLTNVDLLNDDSDYKSRFADMEGKKYVTNASKRHRDLNRCVAFSVKELKQIEDFSLSSF